MSLARIVDAAVEGTVVLSYTRIGPAVRSRLFGWEEPPSMEGRTVFLTGGNSGIGYAAAEAMAKRGATLHLIVRTSEKGEDTVRRLVSASGNDAITYGVADLTDLDAARRVAENFLDRHDHLDVLVNNAGAMFGRRRDVPPGIEATSALHVVAPFILTAALLPALKRSPLGPGRVITVTSGGMYAQGLVVNRLFDPDDYKGATQYARAKRAQVVLTEQWAARVPAREVVFSVMHPGWAATPGVENSLPTFNKVMGPLLRDPDGGADTIVWLASADDATERSGELWLDRRPRGTHRLPNTRADEATRDRLWDRVSELAAVDLPIGH